MSLSESESESESAAATGHRINIQRLYKEGSIIDESSVRSPAFGVKPSLELYYIASQVNNVQASSLKSLNRNAGETPYFLKC